MEVFLIGLALVAGAGVVFLLFVIEPPSVVGEMVLALTGPQHFLESPFMKLRLLATISALVAIPAFAYAQPGGLQPNVPKPTKADAQNVVQIITSDKVKTQAYCDLAKLFDQIQVAKEKNDSNTIQALGKQLLPLVDKLGPEYVKVIEGMDQVDLTSNEGEELLSILSELDKRCTK